MQMTQWNAITNGCAGIVILVVTLLWAPSVSSAQEPWDVEPSYDTKAETLSFKSDGVRLEGTLHYRAGQKNAPAIVATHGAVTPRRDDALYEHLVETLPYHGIAVFLYDRRGSGESGGEIVPGGDFHLLAGDAVAAKRAISKRPQVDQSRVGFWGLSQGGWIAMKAATQSQPAFVILASTPLVTPSEQMTFVARSSLTIEGYPEEIINTVVEIRRAMSEARDDDDMKRKASNLLERHEDASWFQYAFLPTQEEFHNSLETIDRESTLVDFDPFALMQQIEQIPVLVILSEFDPVIPVQKTRDLYEQLPESEHREIYVIPGVDHELIRVEEASIVQEPAQMRPDSGVYMFLLGSWLSRIGMTGK